MQSIEQQLQSAGLSWRIWRNGETFSKNELATHKGSLWIAQQDNATSKPGTDTQWKLAVKSGSTSDAADQAAAYAKAKADVQRERHTVDVVRACQRRGDKLTAYGRALLKTGGNIDAAVQMLSHEELEECRLA